MAKLNDNPDVLKPIIGPNDAESSDLYGKGAASKKARLEELEQSAFQELDSISILNTSSRIKRFDSRREKHAENLVVESIKNRVSNVLLQSANNFESQISSDSATGARIDTLLWSNRKNNVRDKIINAGSGSAESITVAEGFLPFLNAAKDQALSEWKDEYEKRQELFGQKKSWYQFLKKRNDTGRLERLEAFNLHIRKSVEEQFQVLETRTKKIAENTGPIEKLAQTIDRKFNRAPVDKKNKMWDNIKNSLTATNLAGLDFSDFGTYTTDQQKINFLEALKRLDWIQEKFQNAGKSEGIWNHQEILIKSAKTQDSNISSGFSKFKLESFNDLKNQEPFDGQPILNESISTEDLVRALEEDLSIAGEDLSIAGEDLNTYFLESEYNLLVPTTKLLKYLDKIADDSYDLAKKLSPITLQKILRWVSDKNEISLGGVEEYDNQDVLSSLNDLQGDITGATPPLSKGDSTLGQLGIVLQQARSLDIEINPDTDFEDFLNNVTSVQVYIEEKENNFININASIPDEDLQKIKSIWDKVNKAKNYLSEQSRKWKKEKTLWSNWNSERTTGTKKTALDTEYKSLNTFISNIESKVTSSPGKKDHLLLRNAHERKRHIEESLQIIQDKEPPKLSKISAITNHIDTINREHSTNYESQIKISSSTHKKLHERLRDELKKDFSKEIEIEFLKQWEKNDQFESLKNQKGGKVQIQYKKVGVISHLNFPSQLNGTDSKTFKIQRVTDSAVELVEEGGGSSPEIIRITKASVDLSGSEPSLNKNAAIFKGTTTTGVRGTPTIVSGSSPTLAIVTNMKIL